MSNWRAAAACLDSSDLFFAPELERPDERQERIALARSICAACPVWQDCNDFADQIEARHGIWAARDREVREPRRRGRPPKERADENEAA